MQNKYTLLTFIFVPSFIERHFAVIEILIIFFFIDERARRSVVDPQFYALLVNSILILLMSEQCRSRSASTDMLSDQDLHCLLLDSCGYF
jgi:hypothetical protein